MNSRENKLTHKNVDEQIEQCLSSSQDSLTPTMLSLSSTIHDLQGIYEEDRRLEHIWARINTRVSALAAVRIIREAEERSPVLLAQSVLQGTRRTSERSRWWLRLSCLIVGIILVVAIILIAFFTWPMWSHTFSSLHTQVSTHKTTPQTQIAVDRLNMTTYTSQYFSLQYPVDWVITSETPAGSSLQTVRFRSSVMSSVLVQVDAMSGSQYSANQLLGMDADAQLGIVQRTSSVTSHGLPWAVDIIKLTDSAQAPARTLEIAYSNEGTPYRIEFGAPSGMFNSYADVFNVMFASFYPKPSQ